MDARSLAVEMAPIIMWQKGRRPETYRKFWNHPSKTPSKTSFNYAENYDERDMLAGEYLGIYIPLHAYMKHIESLLA